MWNKGGCLCWGGRYFVFLCGFILLLTLFFLSLSLFFSKGVTRVQVCGVFLPTCSLFEPRLASVVRVLIYFCIVFVFLFFLSFFF